MKQILFALVILIGGMTGAAQQYDEVDLLGEWTAISHEGNQIHPKLTSLERVVFGKYTYSKEEWGEEKQVTESFGVVDVIYPSYSSEADYRTNLSIDAFFISNNNKLHIILDDSYSYLNMAFVIKKFTANELILTNYDNTYEVILRKQGASKATPLSGTNNSKPSYNSLDGLKVKNPDKGLYVKKEGEKSQVIYK